MANQEHLDKLQEGVKAWNQWRDEHPYIQPDFSEANLINKSLENVDLRSADLREATLSYTDLRGADLSFAKLMGATLNYTKLNSATLSGATLLGADLSGAHLEDAFLSVAHLEDVTLIGANLISVNLNNAILVDANLIGAKLSGADLSNASLIGTDLSNIRVKWTIFGNVDLSVAKGLETVIHDGPSTIGIDTIYRSHGTIPEVFLRGAGVDDTFITYIRSLVGSAIEYYSCFISYSSKDEAFAKRLYADLQSHNVRCWFAPEDLKWGEKIRIGIDEAIRLHDKLLLILSKSSVASGWVEHEVKAALAKERKEKRVTLFPVRVDKAVLDSPLSWATEIRHERNIGDFTRWKTHDEYEKAFARLLRDLKADSHQTEVKGE